MVFRAISHLGLAGTLFLQGPFLAKMSRLALASLARARHEHRVSSDAADAGPRVPLLQDPYVYACTYVCLSGRLSSVCDLYVMHAFLSVSATRSTIDLSSQSAPRLSSASSRHFCLSFEDFGPVQRCSGFRHPLQSAACACAFCSLGCSHGFGWGLTVNAQPASVASEAWEVAFISSCPYRSTTLARFTAGAAQERRSWGSHGSC